MPINKAADDAAGLQIAGSRPETRFEGSEKEESGKLHPACEAVPHCGNENVKPRGCDDENAAEDT
ncbi:hypothetical protein CCR75_006467 [Bremia lactucae]|uniref:Uncharacterized protein n=1 Tax=Bremia lactucae TaxID=4779 RepID=A0A976IH96_BRELC|nr:hypothetical protein CCR75_006467 [Bremia lactucae]